MTETTEQTEIVPKSPRRRWLPWIFVLIAVCAGLFYVGVLQRSIAVENLGMLFNQTPTPSLTTDPNYAIPTQDPNRLNVLILGIRGEDDPDASDGGPLLTDSIEVLSYDKTTHKASLISIPRDLFVVVHDDKKGKINTIYEYGIEHSANPLQYVKDRFSQITGVSMDNVIVFDFSSFKEIINALGGIDVTLDKPFSETQQWGYTFSLPAGTDHLDGQSALYYARSRYTSDDFDRARRQQQIILAIKDKVRKLNFFSDPVKAFSVITLIRNDIKTDIGIWDVKSFIDLANQVNFSTLNHQVISTDNFVVPGTGPDKAYILLPKSGNLMDIKHFFQNSLN